MTRTFYTLDDYVQTEIRPGLSGAVIGGERSTAVRWEFPVGMERTGIHQHDEHEQFGIVVSGRIELQIGGVTSQLGPGEMYYAPKGIPHGGTVVIGDESA